MQRYLDTLKPIVTERQLEHTRLLVQSFMEGPGPTVQDALLQKRSRMDNWAYDWWLEDMYLAQPLCLPINVNPGMLFPPQDIKSNNDIALLAARVIFNVAQFKDKLDRRALPVERATSREKGQPLCMAQFYRLLTSYRVPGNVKDTLYNSEPDAPSPNQHVIIACRNQFYALHLKTKDRSEGLEEEKIASNIMSILNSPASNITTPPVGILTTQRRDIWAESRDLLRQGERIHQIIYDVFHDVRLLTKLLFRSEMQPSNISSKDSQNVKSLELIENCLMILCLDMTPMTHQFNRRSGPEGLPGHRIGVRDETNICHQMLHGGGSTFNSNNRWFDKTLQIIIGSDGAFGICCEHSPAEGIAVVQLTEQILESCKDLSLGKNPEDIQETSDHLEQLQWTIQPALKKHIREASQSLNNLVEDLDLYIYRFAGYGKNFMKKCAVSPDAFIQLALQLTYHKIYGRLTSTYESASTRRFLLGRVDCIRSASAEANQWTAAMNQISSGSDQVSTDPLQPGKRVTFNLFSEKEKLELFDAAVKKQTEIMIENILGDGIDVHLLGLREQSKLLDHPMDLFKDESFRIANHFALSTSQVPTTSNCVLGYGPVVPDGYGCCYNPWPDSITFCISAFHSSESTKSSLFAQNLEDSLLAMQDLLQSRGT